MSDPGVFPHTDARPAKRVLGIETSCDETGVAVYDSQHGLLANAVFSQIELHEQPAAGEKTYRWDTGVDGARPGSATENSSVIGRTKLLSVAGKYKGRPQPPFRYRNRAAYSAACVSLAVVIFSRMRADFPERLRK